MYTCVYIRTFSDWPNLKGLSPILRGSLGETGPLSHDFLRHILVLRLIFLIFARSTSFYRLSRENVYLRLDYVFLQLRYIRYGLIGFAPWIPIRLSCEVIYFSARLYLLRTKLPIDAPCTWEVIGFSAPSLSSFFLSLLPAHGAIHRYSFMLIYTFSVSSLASSTSLSPFPASRSKK